jgi:hypothetical protein
MANTRTLRTFDIAGNVAGIPRNSRIPRIPGRFYFPGFGRPAVAAVSETECLP